MKMLASLILALLSIAGLANAQFQKGTTELTLDGSAGSYSATSTSNSYGYSYNSSVTRNYAILDLAVGYFVADGLSLEPEIGWYALEKMEPSIHLVANLSYTLPNPTTRFAPFIRAGYGVANMMEFPGVGMLGRVSDKMDVSVLNIGGGVKYLVASSIALRAEINYRKHSLSNSSSYGGVSMSFDQSFSTTGLLLGFSVLL